MLDYLLPHEVLFYIFLKLPSKTLILCSCVSKSWRSLITDKSFIISHLNQTSIIDPDNPLLLLRRIYGGSGIKRGERYSLHFNTESFDFYKELKFPFLNWNENFKLVGFVNGLICLVGSKIFLWNPSIQRFFAVPWPSDIFTTYGTPFKYALGFGFDSHFNDFKLVRLVYREGKSMYDYVLPPEVEIFELSTCCWRKIRNIAPCYEIVKSQWTQVFLNGSVHWVAFIRSHRGFRCIILRFHMSGECFSTISLPDCLVNESPQNLKVALLGGTLSVLRCGWYPFGNRYVSSVWMLRKYDVVESWTRLISVDPSQGLGMALGYRRNGEVLMTSRDGELVSYKPENRLVKGLGIRGVENSFYLGTFVESLALLNEGKGIVKEEDECEDWEE